MFEFVESKFSYSPKVASKLPDCGRNGHASFGKRGGELDKEKNQYFSRFGSAKRPHQICSFMWADNFWIMSHSTSNLEKMPKDLISGS